MESLSGNMFFKLKLVFLLLLGIWYFSCQICDIWIHLLCTKNQALLVLLIFKRRSFTLDKLHILLI